MKFLTLDNETSYKTVDGDIDPSPYHPDNVLVSVGYKLSGDEEQEGYLFFNHSSGISPETKAANRAKLQELIHKADIIIGHNLKFDLSWLVQTGFNLPHEKAYWDTMLCEYVLARGQKPGMSLDDTLSRYGLPLKDDGVAPYMKSKISFENIPVDVVEKYGRQDVTSTYALFLKQRERMALEANAGLDRVLKLSNDFMRVLVDVEGAGIAIDREALSSVGEQYLKEKQELVAKINAIVKEVMGDTPVNIDSPEQLSEVIYSRRVQDKAAWAKTFNLGTDTRGSVVKRRKPKKLNARDFVDAVRSGTTVIHRTRAVRCSNCGGRGFNDFITKAGRPAKRPKKCKVCDGTGLVYTPTGIVAGLRCVPASSSFVTASGFSTNADTLELLSATAPSGHAKEFLTAIVRKNSVDTYLSNFVNGMSSAVGVDGILHTQFMQAVTATGRLSSRKPNMQNMPREKTFPVRKAIISRWKGGKIMDVDFAQLEFRAAVAMAGCRQGTEDILNKVDIHSVTAETLTAAGQPTDRQGAKSHTFTPLYGGMSGTSAEVAYYTAFLRRYGGIKAWQDQLQNAALATGIIRTPSGREYKFDNVKRMASGNVTFSTQIKNYPVQGFATGDIVPAVLLLLFHQMRKAGLKSMIINTVHDSITIDVHPDEIEQVKALVSSNFDVTQYIEDYFGFKSCVPIVMEGKIGDNWMEGEKM